MNQTTRPGGYEGRKERIMFEFLKDEIRRAYRVCGRINGEMQNDRDIDNWEQTGHITTEQADELRQYNRELFRGGAES